MPNLSLRFIFALVIGSVAAAASTAAAVPDVLKRARAYLGPDAVLDSIKSIRFVGSLEVVQDGKPVPQPAGAKIEIIFQKPYQQRVTKTSEQALETTAIDDYDGWTRFQDPKDPARWRMTLMAKEQIKRMRANTWESLAFFKGAEKEGVAIEDLGEATVQGVACDKILFRHYSTVIFIRYFDQATGRLVLTETEEGGSIREEGELMVSGLRFPKTNITAIKADGHELSVTVTFEQITINEVFPANMFQIPPFPSK
jgi:outer membrane lipoprotein-sorting protein